MNALIIYDSRYGNTKQIAEAVGGVLAEKGAARVSSVGDIGTFNLGGIDVLVLGAPTEGHGVSPAMKALVKSMPKGNLQGVRVAAFDTRFNHNLLLTGSAAGSLAKDLQKLGGALITPPESFFVTSDMKSGITSLLGGEIERAAIWARAIA